MSIAQDSVTQNPGPNPAMFNRNSYISVDSSQIPTRFTGPTKPQEYHSMTNMQNGQPGHDNHRSFVSQVQGSTTATVSRRVVDFRWDNQKDCVQVDKTDGKAYFLLTNTSAFTWHPGLTFLLQIGDDKIESTLTDEVKAQNDTKCEFDLRDFAERNISDLPIVLSCYGSWTDPATRERTKYSSQKTKISRIEFK